MKKFSIFLTGINQRLEFYLPQFGGSKIETFVKFLILLISSLLFVFSAGIFLIGTFESGIVTIENGLFNFQIVLSLALLGLLLILITLNGFRRFVDPNNFISVLVFALLAISSAIFSVPVSISNTFGVTSFRSIAGFYVVSTLGIFYLINFVIQDKRILRKLFYTLSTSAFLSVFVILFQGLFIDSATFLTSVIFLMISSVFVLSFANYVNKNKITYTALAGITVLSIALIVLGYDKSKYLNNFIYIITFLFSASLALFIILVNYWQKSQNVLKTHFELLTNPSPKKSKKKNNDRNKSIIYFLGMSLPLIILIFAIALSASNSIQLSTLTKGLNDIRNAVVSVLTVSGMNTATLFKIIFGGGATVLTQTLALNYNSFLAYVVQIQGLLGLSAYLFIWIYGIYNSIKTFRESFERNHEYKLLLPFVFFVIFVPIFSLFQNLSLLLNILWWLSFSVISAYSKISKLDPSVAFIFNDFSVDNFKSNLLQGKRSLIIKLLIVGILVILTGVILYSLSTLTV